MQCLSCVCGIGATSFLLYSHRPPFRLSAKSALGISFICGEVPPGRLGGSRLMVVETVRALDGLAVGVVREVEKSSAACASLIVVGG